MEYKLGYLVCRGETTHKVFIGEIGSLIVESTAVSLTAALLCELVKYKINIVFCDEKHNPCSQLSALYGRHDCSGMLKQQLRWSETIKKGVWTEIVRLKIRQQYLFLKQLNCERADLLQGYLNDLQYNDMTNREGHAAKVYFDSLFGVKFNRGDNTFLNSALNYGYSIILSAFNREIVGDGYITQLGLAHKNEFNFFNLSCDLMEPFRVLVDRYVFDTTNESMSAEYKHSLCNLLNQTVKINGVVKLIQILFPCKHSLSMV